jgi:hypothetical protein
MKNKNQTQILEGNNNHFETIVLKGINETMQPKETYHYIFENSPVPMWIIDLETF